MKDPGLADHEFLKDRVVYRQHLLGPEDFRSLPGADRGADGVNFAAPDRLTMELDGSRLDLSRFDRLCLSAVNRSESTLLAGVTLVFALGQAGCRATPLSFSGGRELLHPGSRVELLFPLESFGSYGSPPGWREIRALILSFGREKTDMSRGEVKVCLYGLSGERRILPQGPRLTEEGLAEVFPRLDERFVIFKMPDGAAGALEASTLRRLAMAVPPPHPYPHEGADEVLAGRIMGQDVVEPMDWRSDPLGIQEWTHFLNRHHFLRTVAQRLDDTREERHAVFLVRSLGGWIHSSPVPVGSNGGAGPSWETLTAAWRLREWLWILGSLRSARTIHADTWSLVLRSVWEHARSLMDHQGHPNNWIIVESAALALAGIAFPQFVEAPRWRAEGLRRLDAEFHKQFFPDGAHYEISPLYHAMSFGAYLDVRCAAKACEIDVPVCFGAPLERCAEYLAALCRPGFTWPSINDAGGAAEDYSALMALAGEVFQRSDLAWIGSKGRKGDPPEKRLRVFPHAGIVTMRSSCDPDAHFLVLRAGPPGAAHIHDDTLSLDVTVLGTPRLVDPGITTYAPGPLTDGYRSAAAHNTLLVDGKGPGYSRMPFTERVKSAGPRLTWSRQGALESATGTCGDFMRGQTSPCAASRTVLFVDGEYWVIRDHVTGGGDHEVAVCWQFFPCDVRGDEQTGEVCCVDGEGVGFTLVPLPGRKTLSIETSTGRWEPPCGWVSLDGSDRPATHVRFSLESSLPLCLFWLLLPGAGGPVSGPRPRRRDEAGGVILLDVTSPGGHEDCLTFFPPTPSAEGERASGGEACIAGAWSVHWFRNGSLAGVLQDSRSRQ